MAVSNVNKTLSVIIITFNAAHCIRACLDSVRFANEIIILDSGSTDDTLLIAKAYTDKIYYADWEGPGLQKNRALAYASCDWVLSIDPDEYLSDRLAQDLQTTIQDAHAHDAYDLVRRTGLCGEYMRFGDTANEKCLRLFKREKAIFNEHLVHESLAFEGKKGKLKGLMFHDSNQDIDSLFRKVNVYSTLRATMQFKKGRTCKLHQAFLHGLARFIRGYILRLGFLDGFAGFIVALSAAEYTFYAYTKLWYLTRLKTKDLVNEPNQSLGDAV